MKKKGFTLIELLAVIVILAVLMVIAVPKILDVIENARKNSILTSAKLYIKTINQYVAYNQLNSVQYPFEFNEDNTYSVEELNDVVKLKGDYPDSGVVFLYKKVQNANFCMNGYNVTYDNLKYKILKDENCMINNDQVEDKNYVAKNEIENIIIYNYENSNNNLNVLKDLYGTSTDATINGAQLNSNGLLFDGEDDYVSIAEFNNNKGTFEINFSINGFNGENQTLIANYEYGGCGMFIDSSASSLVGECYIDEKYLTVNYDEIEVNTNYTASLVYDESSIKLYINGKLISSETYTGEFINTKNNTIIMIGANPNATTAEKHFFDGYVYSARIYSDALTEDDIIQNYNIDKTKYNKNYTEFDRDLFIKYDTLSELNTASVLKDLSGNNNDGIINNALLTENGLFFDGKYATDNVVSVETNNNHFSFTTSFKLEDMSDEIQTIMANYQIGGCALVIPPNSKVIRGTCKIDDQYRYVMSNEIELNKNYVTTLTYDGYNLKLYLDGVLMDSYKNNILYTYPESNTVLMLGSNPLGTTAEMEFFGGTIYYADVYNRALTKNEISVLHTDLLNKYNNKNGNRNLFGLIASYDVNNTLNTENSLNDLGSNGFDGKMQNVIKDDNGLLFNGTDSYVNIKKFDAQKFTFQTKFKVTLNTNAEQDIISNFEGGGCGIYYAAAGDLVGSCKINGEYRRIRSDVLEFNKEYLATLTYDGYNLKFYLDNKLLGTYSSEYPIDQSDSNLMIGVNPQNASPQCYYFNGYINSVKVYNRALSESEIIN